MVIGKLMRNVASAAITDAAVAIWSVLVRAASARCACRSTASLLWRRRPKPARLSPQAITDPDRVLLRCAGTRALTCGRA
jgi:hypothetical protein